MGRPCVTCKLETSACRGDFRKPDLHDLRITDAGIVVSNMDMTMSLVAGFRAVLLALRADSSDLRYEQFPFAFATPKRPQLPYAHLHINFPRKKLLRQSHSQTRPWQPKIGKAVRRCW